jgi:hypothetical protein
MTTVSENFALLVKYAKQFKFTLREFAYLLATVEHETAGTFQPIEEYGGKKARYAPWYGRGFVQLTWLGNYKKYALLLGVPLGDGSWALDADKAAFIICHGMRHGVFTGKRLGHYFSERVTDYLHARKMINGMDKAEHIMELAQKWERKLLKGEVKEFNKKEFNY